MAAPLAGAQGQQINPTEVLHVVRRNLVTATHLGHGGDEKVHDARGPPFGIEFRLALGGSIQRIAGDGENIHPREESLKSLAVGLGSRRGFLGEDPQEDLVTVEFRRQENIALGLPPSDQRHGVWAVPHDRREQGRVDADAGHAHLTSFRGRLLWGRISTRRRSKSGEASTGMWLNSSRASPNDRFFAAKRTITSE